MVITDGGDLALVERPQPRPRSTEVLVRMAAASVNHADLAQRRGLHDPRRDPVGSIAGMDGAGTVVRLGDDVDTMEVGDRVMGLIDGAFAEFALLDARLALSVPETWTMTEAAAAVSGLLTEYHALAMAADLRPGETVVVHGAGSGVGLTGLQVVRQLGAGLVIASLRSSRTADLATAAGADVVLSAERGSLSAQILDATDGRGADVIVDHVGGASLPGSLEALALGGRLISVGRLGGGAGTLDLERLAFKRARVIGVTFRTRTVEEHASIVRGVARDLLPAMEGGAMRPIVDRVYPLADVAAAYARMAAGEHRGKLVVAVDRSPD